MNYSKLSQKNIEHACRTSSSEALLEMELHQYNINAFQGRCRKLFFKKANDCYQNSFSACTDPCEVPQNQETLPRKWLVPLEPLHLRKNKQASDAFVRSSLQTRVELCK